MKELTLRDKVRYAQGVVVDLLNSVTPQRIFGDARSQEALVQAGHELAAFVMFHDFLVASARDAEEAMADLTRGNDAMVRAVEVLRKAQREVDGE